MVDSGLGSYAAHKRVVGRKRVAHPKTLVARRNRLAAVGAEGAAPLEDCTVEDYPFRTTHAHIIPIFAQLTIR